MIKRIILDELKPGMYVCGFEKEGDSQVSYFMNNILIKSPDDIDRFRNLGYRAAHIELPDDYAETRDAGASGAEATVDVSGCGELSSADVPDGVPSPANSPKEGLMDLSEEEEEYNVMEMPENDLVVETSPVDLDGEAIENLTGTGEWDLDSVYASVDEGTAVLDADDSADTDLVDEDNCEENLPEPALDEKDVPGEETSSLPVDTNVDNDGEEEAQEEPVDEKPGGDEGLLDEIEAEAGDSSEGKEEEGQGNVISIFDAYEKVSTDHGTEVASGQTNYKEEFGGYKEELIEAKNIRSGAESLVHELMNSIKNGDGIVSEKVHGTVEKMVESIFRNQDALTSLTRLKSLDNYTIIHSVNVCTLALAMGRHMGLLKQDLQALGVGAILHDVGKMLVPEEILNKPGKLTDDEIKQIREHTVLGADLLYKTPGINDDSREVAAQHHERQDGKGYPKGLAGDKIAFFSRLTAVADCYDAMTSDRVYQKGMRPDEALKKIYIWRRERFEPSDVERLISCLGIYPIGSLVELNTGEIAVVRLPNHTQPLQPLVMMVYDKDRKPYSKHFALALNDDDNRWITHSHDPEEFGDRLHDLAACV